MSKQFFINNLDSPLGQALHKRIYNPEEESANIIGTYIDHERKDKIPGVRKILKVLPHPFLLISLAKQAQALP